MSIPWRVSSFNPWPDILLTNYFNTNATYSNGVITASEMTGGSVFIHTRRFDLYGTQIGSVATQSIPSWGTHHSVVNLNSYVLFFNTGTGTIYYWFNWNGASYQSGTEITASAQTVTKETRGRGIWVNGYHYAVGSNSGPTHIARYNAPNKVPGTWLNSVSLGLFIIATAVMLGGSDTGHIYVMIGAEGSVQLWKFDAALNLVHHWGVADTNGTMLGARADFFVWNNLICFNRAPVSNVYTIRLVKINDDLTLRNYGSVISGCAGDSSPIHLGGCYGIDPQGVFSLCDGQPQVWTSE